MAWIPTQFVNDLKQDFRQQRQDQKKKKNIAQIKENPQISEEADCLAIH